MRHSAVRACDLPDRALLRRYLGQDAYVDCYVTEVAGPVGQPAYVEAFYTTPVFKLERLLLSLLVARPSTDAQARELALGQRTAFAAWHVEARESDQLLLSDFRGHTRSWLMSAPASGGQTASLYFGSAVMPVLDGRTGERRISFAYRALLGFHKIYSRILLSAATRRLAVSTSPH